MNTLPFSHWSPVTDSAIPKSTFETIVIASDLSQIADVAPDAPDTLLLTTEWHAWWQWRKHGGQAVHLDYFLTDWNGDEFGGPEDLYHSASDWLYMDGGDATVFEGISLGHQFDSEIATADFMFRRLHLALNEACTLFKPSIIVLRDLRAYNAILDNSVKRLLVRDVAQKADADLRDELHGDEIGGVEFQDAVLFAGGVPKESAIKKLLRSAVAMAIEPLFYMAWRLRGSKPKVFFALSEQGLEGMVAAGRNANYTPVFVGERSTKRPSFLLNCLRAGAHPALFPSGRLSAENRQRVDEISSLFRTHWAANPAATAREEARRLYVIERLFDSGKFMRMASFAIRNIRFFQRHDIRRIVICDIRTSVSRIPAEIGKRRGLPIDELLNGIFVTPLKDVGRCGDKFSVPLVDRNLAWGTAFQPWFTRIRPNGKVEIAGYPAIDLLRHKRPATQDNPRLSTVRNVLLLTVYSGIADAKALRSNTVTYFVQLLQQLNALGMTVRLKTHPGADNPAYFRALASTLGFPCHVVGRNERLADHVHWADAVVGPVSSGAYVETLALGKPYIGVVPEQSSIDMTYFAGLPIVRNAVELQTLFASDPKLDPNYALDLLCASDDNGTSTGLMQSILEKSL